MAVFNATKIAIAVLDLLAESREGFAEKLPDVIRQHAGDCLSHCKDDEPIFVLCARDLFAPSVVREWAARVSGLPAPDQQKVTGALHCANEMERWPGAKKLPGTSASEKVYPRD